MNLGENIYRLRSQRNMSQGDLADALEVSRQSVSKWENNNAVPDLDKLVRMSRLFGISLDQLVGTDSPVPPPQPAVTKTVIRESAPTQRIVGIVLLCFGLFALLILSLLGGIIIGAFVGFPFILVGSVLLSGRKDPLFRAAWILFAVYAPLLFYFMLFCIGYGLYLRYAMVGLWLGFLILWAVIRRRGGRLSSESLRFIRNSLLAALALMLLLGALTSVIYRVTGLQSANQELDVSVVQVD